MDILSAHIRLYTRPHSFHTTTNKLVAKKSAKAKEVCKDSEYGDKLHYGSTFLFTDQDYRNIILHQIRNVKDKESLFTQN